MRRLTIILALIATIATSCGSDSSSEDTKTQASKAEASDAESSEAVEAQSSADTSSADPETSSTPIDLGRVVVLAEEFLLADVLGLGIEPVASSATVPAAGFQGLQEFETAEIEVLSMTGLSLENLAAMKPDTIITLQFWVDQIGSDVLDEMAETIIALPDGLSNTDRLVALGGAVGRETEAGTLIQRLDIALAEGRQQLDEGCEVTMVAIYSGPSVAAFVEPIWDLPRAVDELGCKLVPGPDLTDADRNGRAFLSLEQIGLLQGSEIVMLQTDTVVGEQDAISSVSEMPLWQQLPAVRAGEVSQFDRLGYPGVLGQIRFIEDFLDALS